MLRRQHGSGDEREHLKTRCCEQTPLVFTTFLSL